MSKLYLYVKEPSLVLRKSKDQLHEVMGGKYAARVQVGTEKDGSPMYRYFDTREQYENYVSKKKNRVQYGSVEDKQGAKQEDKAAKKRDSSLEQTLKEKQEKAKREANRSSAARRGEKRAKDVVQKSVTLYITKNKGK